MKKTSIYLTDEEVTLLRRLSASTGRAQSQLVRDAIAEYATAHPPTDRFPFVGIGASDRSPTTSIADDEDEALEGFGED